MAAWPRPSSRIGRCAGVAALLWICVACGSSSHHSAAAASVTRRRPPASTNSSYRAATSTPSSSRRGVLPHRVRVIGVLPAVRRQGLFRWTPAVAVRGQAAVWISRVKAYREVGFTVTLLRWHQSLVTLVLNPGSSQPGGAGWPYGDMIGPAERRTVVAAFNSAFQENYGAGGFEEGGRVGWPLRRGMASVVIYRDGFADIGRWKATVPARDRPVAAIRQNLGLLIDAGRVAPTVDHCIKVCWGDPLHEQPIVARSGLGVSADGDLIWAAGHNLSVRALAEALAGGGAVRAMELDIKPAMGRRLCLRTSQARGSPGHPARARTDGDPGPVPRPVLSRLLQRCRAGSVTRSVAATASAPARLIGPLMPGL